MFKRQQYTTLYNRLKEPRRFIQVVMGPRQVGKTTLIRQILDSLDKEISYLFFLSDNVPVVQNSWISDCWETARTRLKIDGSKEIILVIDEIQKLNGWSEVVKKEWDSDTFNEINIKVVLLGSSRVMLQKGLADSLAGRFETIRMTHWGYAEMKEAFGISLDQYIYYGGYPGAAALIGEDERWSLYIRDSIVESTINKDILYDTPISKPALLKQTFELGASYSGKIVSFTKMVGSLQDAGNATTLAGYLNLLAESGLLAGLQKYAVDMSRRKASIPKFQVYNNALRTVFNGYSFSEAIRNPGIWGFFVESAIGAYLVSCSFIDGYEVFYWREGNYEVDYIIKKNEKVVAIEVKSGSNHTTAGLGRFRDTFNPHSAFIVGSGGIGIEEFLSLEIKRLFE